MRHRNFKLQWFLITIITVFISGTIIYKIECLNNNEDSSGNRKFPIEFNLPKKSLLSLKNTTDYLKKQIISRIPSVKHVTKSLIQLGKMDEVNKHFLFLNSVPNSGSEILIFLLELIQGGNNFKHVRLKGGNKRKLNKIQQEEIIDEIYNIRRDLAVPLSFDRTVYFVNFTAFDKQLPIYINLIRHPIAKVMTKAFLKETGNFDSYFIRCLLDNKRNCNFKNGRPYDLTIPYFCGHDPKCMLLNNEWAYETAKKNVEKYYHVVGVLEELNKTLEVLEKNIPQFFTGSKEAYQQYLFESYKHKKDPDIPHAIREKLEKTLLKEIEFYAWIKMKLFEKTR